MDVKHTLEVASTTVDEMVFLAKEGRLTDDVRREKSIHAIQMLQQVLKNGARSGRPAKPAIATPKR